MDVGPVELRADARRLFAAAGSLDINVSVENIQISRLRISRWEIRGAGNDILVAATSALKAIKAGPKAVGCSSTGDGHGGGGCIGGAHDGASKASVTASVALKAPKGPRVPAHSALFGKSRHLQNLRVPGNGEGR